ncbi:MAG: hypothetical protein K8W52_15140 [Deltaproteobacteria bacterium]|nr:hypothetical protein [Deltaproteobacteria bacterium]
MDGTMVARALTEDGWTVSVERGPYDLIAFRGNDHVGLLIAAVHNGSWALLRGGFADALLRALALERQGHVGVPIAIVTAPRISPAMIARLAAYRDRFAPSISWGAVAADGHVALRGRIAREARPPRSRRGATPRQVNLFGDVGQRVLKALALDALGLPGGAPATDRTAAEFARELGISRSFAWAVLDELRRLRVLDDHDRADAPALLALWCRRYQSTQTTPWRWSRAGDPTSRARALARSGEAALAGRSAAAEHLGGRAPGVPELAVRSHEVALAAGLVPCAPGEAADAHVHLAPEAVLRSTMPADDHAALLDPVQCWLDLIDVSHADADALWRRVFRLA